MNPKKTHKSRFVRVLYSTALTCVLSVFSNGTALAAPEGGLVVGGSAVIERSGQTTTVRQSSNRGIIRWDSFDVEGSERVDFQQPSSSAITVNRIQDSKPSQIDGHITANGRLVLINPNGVVFGAGSHVDVGGLVATSSDLEDDNAFLSGGPLRLTRPGDNNAKIINHGTITTQEGGFAGLIAPHVENHGLIEARLGKVTLASGDVSTVDFAGDGLIQIEVSDQVLKQESRNNGLIRTDGGTIIMTAATGRNIVENLLVNEGLLQANTSGEQKGSIQLKGATTTTQNTGLIHANGDTTQDAGHIEIDSSFVSLGGSIAANGRNGGQIDISAGTLSLADQISAEGIAGTGGTINILSQKSWETSTSSLNASGTLAGGFIRHVAEEQIMSSGAYQANSTLGQGGKIDVSAWSTKFLGARLQADGLSGGGTIRLGGEYQGGKDLAVDELPNARYLIVDRGTSIKAEATGTTGDGGQVILWSDEETVALGSIFVKPGTQSGSGGFVEVSSGQTPKFDATIEAGRGSRSGTVLLDPKNILISDFSFNSTAIILGYGFQGGRTNNDTNLDAGDSLGFTSSLDGNRMVVGAYQDDGYGNTMTNTGAAYLFSFTDDSFSGALLEGIIGHGYTGGKNVNLTLNNNDYFGYGVSLDGNRLAVGAYGGDGSANAVGDSGEVYLFSFSDSTFSDGTLEAMIGRNYTGGKNVDISQITGSDYFGTSVALDGNRLAVGASGGDGSGNTVSGAGDVYLFSFSDSTFSSGVLQATIGNGYTGGKNINLTLEANDVFGAGIDLDGTQLIVGAERDDGFGNSLTDSGAAYLFNFSDSSFSGGVLRGTIGYGYTGGNNLNITDLSAGDYFGTGVAIDSNRLAIGAMYDDGRLDVGAASGNYGAVRLFTVDNANFDNPVLQSTIGYQYKNQSKDYDLWGLGIGGNDYFGKSVSLDGDRLLVGAYGDDGIINTNSQAGAVYGFTFSDLAFSTPNLEGIVGSGYVQGRNYNIPNLSDADNNLGIAVSIDGTKLAVGSYLDDGFNGQRQGSGAVYLYNFDDTNYTNGTLQAIIGDGYTGGNNYNQALRPVDGLGVSVSLDGNRLAVGAYLDDGNLAGCGNCGAAYLYTFSDSTFAGITLQSRIGFGYTGAKDINVALGNSDQFGRSISLDGNRLAVGAIADDGFGNSLTDSGAVYLFTFADSTFTGGALQGVVGRGYTGGKNIDNTGLDASDNFGRSISLDGNRLAVGAQLDDGNGNTLTNSGAAYLFTFADSTFTGGALAAKIGNGYTGGNNINMTLGASDQFGYSVALSGNYLFVGAIADDGMANAVGDSGAVFRYSFATSTFTGGALASSIGARYIGTNDYDMRGYLGGSDVFGSSISVDGQNLVVGAYGDDGFGNNATDAGAIFLLRYTDMTYSTPELKGVAGAGYGESYLNKSFDTFNVKESDYYGYSVALDGTQMAVGAQRDDGFNDVGTDRGAVYLYTFSDTSYTGGTLQAIIGSGYTGGKNINLTLGNSDYFGSAVSLDGNRLAVGAYLDDGSTNTVADSGAVYLYSFSDSAFTGGTLQATIGNGYTGGKNINLAVAASDYFGWSVSLDGNRLAVGAQRDDGQANNRTDAGAAYLYTFSDSLFTGGALQSIIGYGYTGGKNINLSTLDGSDYFGSAISLDGNRVAIGAPLDNGSGNALNDSGAVYLYSFSDSVFTGGALQSTIGYGYTGGKNINVSSLETFDWFGSSVSLNGNRVAIGIEQDDGYLNQATDSGAAQLYSFSDSVFTGGSLQSTIGYRYTGGKNFDLGQSLVADVSERYSSVALDGNNFLVGGHRDGGMHMGNSGSVALMSFSDSSFNGATLNGISGNGYAGRKSISLNPSFYSTPDNYGYSVSLSSNRLAVGTINDDGQANSMNNVGAVYLYSIPGGDYDSILLEGILGYGYTGGKNFDLTNYLERLDAFGSAVSLDGNRLAVSAYLDDGLSNTITNAGAVYLFNFSDSAFSSPALQARIGNGYTGGKNINLPVTSSDYFGWSLSLDGNRLAVGAQRDDGNANVRSDSGAVYLFSFSDSAFTGGTLQSTIGYGYTGGKNYNLSALENSDFFGNGVSLDGNRLAVSALNDDGNANAQTNSGAAYLFTFSDSLFSTPALASTIGAGYTGGNNYAHPNLIASDQFGSSISLDGTVLAIGAVNDQGYNLNTGGRQGAIFLYSFADLSFNNPIYDSTVGYLYTGGKNINIAVGGSFGNAISLDSGVLVAGAPGTADITSGFVGTGRVYIFRDSLLPISSGSAYATLGGSTIGITAASIAGLLSSGTNVTLQASNDITIASPIFVNNGTGDGGTLTLQAGRSIFQNAAIETDNGDLNFYANENLATGVLNTHRETGAAVINMGTGSYINAGTGSVVFRIDAGTGKTYAQAGDMTLRTITADSFTALSSTQTGNIYTNGVITANGAGDAIILDSGANFINNYGAGALVTPSGRWLVYSDHDDYTTTGGLSPDFTYYECVYMGACSPAVPGVGNGILYEYNVHLLSISVNTSRAYGDANPNSATLQSLFIYSGFEGLDDASVLDVLPTASVTAASNANAGTTHTITLTGGSDNYYSYYLLGGLLTINKKDITATANTSLSKVYGDVNPSLNSSYYNYVGLANSETSGVITATPNYGTIDGTTGAGSYDVGAAFTATNYTITNAPLITLTINKRNITSAWTGPLSKTYGDANPTVDTNNFTYTGFVNADGNSSVTASADFLGVDATTDVGSYTAEGVFTSANYNVTNTPTTTFSITKRNITAVVDDDSRAYGDANPAWDWSHVAWSNLANSEDGSVLDSLTLAATTALATSGAGTTHAIALSGFSDNNYNLTGSTSGTLTITKRDITAAWTGPLSKIYGNANPGVDTNNFTYTGLVNGNTNTAITASADFLGVDATTDVGSYSVDGVFTSANYNVTNTPTTTLSITKRNITAVVGDDSRAYGDANPAWDWSHVAWSNLANSENGSVLDSLTLAATTALATSNAGTTHAIALSGFNDNNYNLTGSTSGTLTITKRDITAVVGDDSRAYGDANPAWDWSHVAWSNLANSQDGSVLDSLTLAATTALATSNAGTTHAIALSGFSDNNYNLTGSTSGTLTITKRNITAVVDDDSRVYGDANPAWDWSHVAWSNLANSQDGSVLDSLTLAATTALATSNAGTTHAIALSGFSDNNYNLTGSTSGTLTITKRDITAVVGAHTQEYGLNTIALDTGAIVWSNTVNGDAYSAMDSIVFSAPTLSSLSGAGTSHTLDISSFSDTNYNLTGTTAGTIGVDKAALILTVLDASRRKGEQNPAFEFSLEGLKNGETQNVLSNLAFSTPANEGSTTGTYSITASGGDADNYLISSYIDGILTVTAPPAPDQPDRTILPSTYESVVSQQNNLPSGSGTAGLGGNRVAHHTTLLANQESAGVGAENNSGRQNNQSFMIIPDSQTENLSGYPGNVFIFINEKLKQLFGL